MMSDISLLLNEMVSKIEVAATTAPATAPATTPTTIKIKRKNNNNNNKNKKLVIIDNTNTPMKISVKKPKTLILPSKPPTLNSCLNHFDAFLSNAKLDKKDYQVSGIRWCLHKELSLKTGGIIADEMGLGKTIMMIGLTKINPLKRTLIVLPVVLIMQWHDQIFKTTGIKPLLFYGPDKKACTLHTLSNANFVICSYHSLHLKSNNSLIHSITWDRVIFDEAHHLRNRKTLLFNGASKLNSKLRWFITATPIQNNIHDIVSILQLLFKREDFKSKEDIDKLLKDFMLRRTKLSVGISLPSVTQTVVNVDWTTEKDLAKDIHTSISCLGVSGGRTYAGKEYHSLLEKSIRGQSIIAAIVRARQACILPSLTSPFVTQVYSDTSDIESPQDKIDKFDFTSHNKIKAVVDLILQRKDNGNSKIVFCNFRAEIDLIYNSLISHSLTAAVIDGRCDKKQRDSILQSTFDVLILQIQTGCEGLNLQAYNEIYFVSPHWNPAVEDQAVARCHRIGQIKPVFVFRFCMDSITSSTSSSTSTSSGSSLESYIKNVQQHKRDIASNTLLSSSPTYSTPSTNSPTST